MKRKAQIHIDPHPIVSTENQDKKPKRQEFDEKLHARNALRDRPDFKELGTKYPEFGKFLSEKASGKLQLDWTNGEAVREYNITLLKHYYNITLTLPSDQLCPPVANRANYIHWIEDLIQIDPASRAGRGSVRGIDIGTGASCIYPLLGCKINHPNWSFLAVDNDAQSLYIAEQNLNLNRQWLSDQNQSSLIQLRHVTDGTTLDYLGQETYDFLMTNPPFFSDLEETQLNERVDATAKATEVVTQGGEVEFVGKIVENSMRTKGQVTWYTAMIGRKIDLTVLERKLRQCGVPHVKTSELSQGKTTRWAIAWSFTVPPPVRIVRPRRNFQIQHKILNSEVHQKIQNHLASHNILTRTDEEGRIAGQIELEAVITDFIITITQSREDQTLVAFYFSPEGNGTAFIDELESLFPKPPSRKERRAEARARENK
ncbi:methyltransferase-like protein 16 [Planoprotostelium fungivorum]|uniref:Methyltransferase-like protein 16 n=1 Tax=Planoprotostelium fungivorum TaxID=1890364 RepID=A0A2P6NPR9_9EUKA|nr:methyltransferase-like protein 16 [Planoprotostelium fungivorum]